MHVHLPRRLTLSRHVYGWQRLCCLALSAALLACAVPPSALAGTQTSAVRPRSTDDTPDERTRLAADILSLTHAAALSHPAPTPSGPAWRAADAEGPIVGTPAQNLAPKPVHAGAWERMIRLARVGAAATVVAGKSPWTRWALGLIALDQTVKVFIRLFVPDAMLPEDVSLKDVSHFLLSDASGVIWLVKGVVGIYHVETRAFLPLLLHLLTASIPLFALGYHYYRRIETPWSIAGFTLIESCINNGTS